MNCLPWLMSSICQELSGFEVPGAHAGGSRIRATASATTPLASTRVCDQSFPSPRWIACHGWWAASARSFLVLRCQGLMLEGAGSEQQPVPLLLSHLPGFVIRVFHLLDGLPAMADELHLPGAFWFWGAKGPSFTPSLVETPLLWEDLV
jgi:hypothetical protein